MIFDMKSGLFLKILFLIVIGVSGFLLFRPIEELLYGPSALFAHAKTQGWILLEIGFWMFWVAGGVLMFLKSKYAYIFLHPVAIATIPLVAFSLRYVIYKDLSTQFIYYSSLLVSLFIIFTINRKSILDALNTPRLFVFIGNIILLVFIIAFLTIKEYKTRRCRSITISPLD